MSEPILLCTDLDRTLLPNGKQSESPLARPLFRALCAREEVTLAYVSGRDKGLLLEAIEQFQIPEPDYAIGDVGSSLYNIRDGLWQQDPDWQAHIAVDWHDYEREQLQRLLPEIPGLRLQEKTKQNRFKLSYYLDLQQDSQAVLAQMQDIFSAQDIHSSLIWSVDEPARIGLIDVLPCSANKLEAIRFLSNKLALPSTRTLFAGDSGNDLSVLCSEVPAVLVANAEDYVRQEALQQATPPQSLYCARGLDDSLNGNYAAGIIEGLLHYFPEANSWLEAAYSSLNSSSSS